MASIPGGSVRLVATEVFDECVGNSTSQIREVGAADVFVGETLGTLRAGRGLHWTVVGSTRATADRHVGRLE